MAASPSAAALTVDDLADAIEHHVIRARAPLQAEIISLRKEIGSLREELGKRSTLKYEGVWNSEKVYNVGDFVTENGSLWHCWDANVGVRPGSSDKWQLAVKRGRDGKDGR